MGRYSQDIEAELMITTRTPVVLCPLCGHTLDAASSVTNPDERPDPGDFSVCIGCAGVLRFDDQRRLTLPRAGEVEGAMREDPDIRRAIDVSIRAIRHLHATVGPPPWSRGKRS